MNWSECNHEWARREGMSGCEVVCLHCSCPGSIENDWRLPPQDRDDKSKWVVFWPAN